VILYFDTSALVRRYHITEPGAASVRRLCHRLNGNFLVILSITSVEVASAFNRKVQEGWIDAAQRDRMWRLFLAHQRTRYQVVPLTTQIVRRAQRLLFRHRLRAYDALQLAAALEFARSLPRGTEYRFCTADRPQARAAEGEGLLVEIIS
jgi:predicted nucleic acid-binding protein